MKMPITTTNEATIMAMEEAQDDANLTTVDMNSYDSFLKSLEINNRDI